MLFYSFFETSLLSCFLSVSLEHQHCVLWSRPFGLNLGPTSWAIGFNHLSTSFSYLKNGHSDFTLIGRLRGLSEVTQDNTGMGSCPLPWHLSQLLSLFSVPTIHPVLPAPRMVCLTGRNTKGKFCLIRTFRAHRICNSPASAQESGSASSIPPSPYPFTVLAPVSSLSL